MGVSEDTFNKRIHVVKVLCFAYCQSSFPVDFLRVLDIEGPLFNDLCRTDVPRTVHARTKLPRNAAYRGAFRDGKDSHMPD